MASREELRAVRLAKRVLLERQGISVHPRQASATTTIKDLIATYHDDRKLGLVGRVTAIRGSGAISFVVFNDGTGEFQAVIKKDVLGEESTRLFADVVDIGDFIIFTGTTFTTNRGAQSILVKSWHMAGKSLLPLPDKWSGLQDQEELYRKRYLDLLSSNETRERFEIRSKIIRSIRTFFDTRDFLEVETPILQSQAGGAMAKTFNTYHNDLAMPMVLRISLEIDHKLIMVGGVPRIYEIGKNFRNEGSDPTHIQEFTMIEWYAAYANLAQNITWTQELLVTLARDVVGKMSFSVLNKDGLEQLVDFGGTWPVVRFDDLVKENTGLDIHTASDDEVRVVAAKYGMSRDEQSTTSRANIIDFIYKKSSRNNIIHPTFVTNYPGDLKPLAQQNLDGTAEVAQLIIAGAEITNQYAELVDPLVQRELLERQSQAKQDGDQEAMDIDERFLTAMEYGMPPMTGFGMGIDRLVALLTEQRNLRDVIYFPIMKMENQEYKKTI